METQLLGGLKHILKKLIREDDRQYFLQPVSTSIPGCEHYHEIIEQPMDLGTIEDRFNLGGYLHPAEAVRDIRQTFKNAMVFNSNPMHLVHVAAKRLLDRFETDYKALLLKVQRTQTKGKCKPSISLSSKAKKRKNVPDMEELKSIDFQNNSNDLYKKWVLNKYLGRMRSKPDAYGDLFFLPVNYQAEGLWDYPQLVPSPMDLGTVETKLLNNEYTTLFQVYQDILLVWENCITYHTQSPNAFGHLVDYGKKKRAELKKKFATMLRNKTVTSASSSSISSVTRVLAASDQSNGSNSSSDTEIEFEEEEESEEEEKGTRIDDVKNSPHQSHQDQNRKILLRRQLNQLLVKKLKTIPESQFFHDPVNLSVYSTYTSVVKRPICLNDVLAHIKQGKYDANQQLFVNDVNLIWKNAQAYNLPTAIVYEHSQVMQLEFKKMISNGISSVASSRPVASIIAPKVASKSPRKAPRSSTAPISPSKPALPSSIFSESSSTPSSSLISTTSLSSSSSSSSSRQPFQQPPDINKDSVSLSSSFLGSIPTVRPIPIVENEQKNRIATPQVTQKLKLKEIASATPIDQNTTCTPVVSMPAKPLASNILPKPKFEQVPNIVIPPHFSPRLSQPAEYDRFEQVITAMKRDKKIAFFTDPVDEVAHKAVNYYKIIECPMWLSKVQEKILDRDYKKNGEFFHDMMLIWGNCKIYNPPTSAGKVYYDCAVRLETKFIDQFRKIFRLTKKDIQKQKPLTPEELDTMIASSQDMRKAQSILKTLQELKFGVNNDQHYASDFSFPLDPEKDKLPGYLDVVHTPMDLQTIQEMMKPKSLKIRNIYQFAAHVRMVFHNAIAYYPCKNQVFIKAVLLLNEFNLLFNEKLLELNRKNKKKGAPKHILSMAPNALLHPVLPPKSSLAEMANVPDSYQPALLSPIQRGNGSHKARKDRNNVAIDQTEETKDSLGPDRDDTKSSSSSSSMSSLALLGRENQSHFSTSSSSASATPIISTSTGVSATTCASSSSSSNAATAFHISTALTSSPTQITPAKLPTALKSKLQTITREMIKYYPGFKFPVDPLKYGLLDYFEKIKTPMDLTTIRRKLVLNLYQTVDAFIADMECIWKNVFAYYAGFNSSDGRMLNQRARDLQHLFHDRLEKATLKRAESAPSKRESEAYFRKQRRAMQHAHQQEILELQKTKGHQTMVIDIVGSVSPGVSGLNSMANSSTIDGIFGEEALRQMKKSKKKKKKKRKRKDGTGGDYSDEDSQISFVSSSRQGTNGYKASPLLERGLLTPSQRKSLCRIARIRSTPSSSAKTTYSAFSASPVSSSSSYPSILATPAPISTLHSASPKQSSTRMPVVPWTPATPIRRTAGSTRKPLFSSSSGIFKLPRHCGNSFQSSPFSSSKRVGSGGKTSLYSEQSACLFKTVTGEINETADDRLVKEQRKLLNKFTSPAPNRTSESKILSSSMAEMDVGSQDSPLQIPIPNMMGETDEEIASQDLRQPHIDVSISIPSTPSSASATVLATSLSANHFHMDPKTGISATCRRHLINGMSTFPLGLEIIHILLINTSNSEESQAHIRCGLYSQKLAADGQIDLLMNLKPLLYRVLQLRSGCKPVPVQLQIQEEEDKLRKFPDETVCINQAETRNLAHYGINSLSVDQNDDYVQFCQPLNFRNSVNSNTQHAFSFKPANEPSMGLNGRAHRKYDNTSEKYLTQVLRALKPSLSPELSTLRPNMGYLDQMIWHPSGVYTISHSLSEMPSSSSSIFQSFSILAIQGSVSDIRINGVPFRSISASLPSSPLSLPAKRLSTSGAYVMIPPGGYDKYMVQQAQMLFHQSQRSHARFRARELFLSLISDARDRAKDEQGIVAAFDQDAEGAQDRQEEEDEKLVTGPNHFDKEALVESVRFALRNEQDEQNAILSAEAKMLEVKLQEDGLEKGTAEVRKASRDKASLELDDKQAIQSSTSRFKKRKLGQPTEQDEQTNPPKKQRLDPSIANPVQSVQTSDASKQAASLDESGPGASECLASVSSTMSSVPSKKKVTEAGVSSAKRKRNASQDNGGGDGECGDEKADAQVASKKRKLLSNPTVAEESVTKESDKVQTEAKVQVVDTIPKFSKEASIASVDVKSEKNGSIHPKKRSARASRSRSKSPSKSPQPVQPCRRSKRSRSKSPAISLAQSRSRSRSRSPSNSPATRTRRPSQRTTSKRDREDAVDAGQGDDEGAKEEMPKIQRSVQKRNLRASSKASSSERSTRSKRR